MTYLAIMRWNAQNRVEKFQEFPTLAEAQEFAAKGGTLPGTVAMAFAVLNPGGSTADLLCDPVAKTVTISLIPPTKEQVNTPIRAQIVAKERLTDRRVREMVLRWAKAALPADDADRVALEAREAEFAALRAQLQP